jgi:DNA-binding beta-propeller fold protein YncE
MRKTMITLLAATAAVSCLSAAASAATQSTGYTITQTITGQEAISQDAYVPSAMYLNLALKQAQDLFILDNIMYIADTGNERILRIDTGTNEMTEIGLGVLDGPRGVCADEQGRIYVADKEKAYRFTPDGELEFTFVRPTTPNFGEIEAFKPAKIAPAEGGGVYIISDGTQAGIIHLAGNGDFLGYFATNQVRKTAFELLLDLILNEEQKSKLLNITPPSFENIFRGSDGLIYTINKGGTARIKKHSINGVDMLSSNRNLPELSMLADLCVTTDGRLICIDTKGYITEISFDGYLLCKFAGSVETSPKIGLFTTPSGIGTDDEGRIYVLDKDRDYVQVFSPTAVQNRIKDAIVLYNTGRYDESIDILRHVLKYNNSSYFAHLYLGMNHMQKTSYEEAAEQFRIAGSREYYSEAFWETRNIWLQRNVRSILVLGIVGLVLLGLLRLLIRRKRLLRGLQALHRKWLGNRTYYDLSRIGFMMKHPIDNVYDIAKRQTGGWLSASILYIAVFALLILYQTRSGFLYSVSLYRFSLSNNAFLYFGGLALFITSNYYISSIHDGEGTLKSIYVSTAYSLAPILFMIPPVILLANVATYNEQYLITTLTGVAIAISAVYTVLALIGIHNYNFKETVANLLLTFFFMAVIIFALSIAYLLLKQILDFIISIVVEVNLRA